MAGAQEDNSEFSFNTAVRGIHVYRSVATTSWTAFKSRKEHGNAQDHFAIAVRAVTRADDDKPIVGHCCFFVASTFSIFFSFVLFTFKQAIS